MACGHLLDLDYLEVDPQDMTWGTLTNVNLMLTRELSTALAAKSSCLAVEQAPDLQR